MANNYPLVYETVSVHFDRLNIVKRVERVSNKKEIKINLIPTTYRANDLFTSLTKETEIIKINTSALARIINNDISLNSKDVPQKIITFTVNDTLSMATRNKMSKAVRYLNFVTDTKKVDIPHTSKVINFKIAFVTFTLSSSQIHTDNEIKSKLLNQLFIELKNKYKVQHYVWRCEKQSNGNVHFHVLVDQFLPHDKIRELWNRLQNKLGYVDRYSERMKAMSYSEYKELFNKRIKYDDKMIRAAWIKGKLSQWMQPNSTDIHSLQYINNIDAYLIKYMQKDEQNKDIEGRLWGCSHSLSNIKGGISIVDTSISAELNKLYATGKARFFTSAYYTICFADIMFLKFIGCNILFELYREFLINHFKVNSV